MGTLGLGSLDRKLDLKSLTEVSLQQFGDFNDWNREEFHAEKNGFGVFSITLPAKAGG